VKVSSELPRNVN